MSTTVDVATSTVTHNGQTFVMRPLSNDAFTVMLDGEPVGRAVYTFGAANGVAEGDRFDDDAITAIAEAWFAATDAG